MAELELSLILSLITTTILFLVLALLGRGEMKIRFMKMMGGFRGRIVAKEVRKDGKVYTYRPRIMNNKIKLNNRTYDYNIKHTVMNKYDLREGYFSEITGKQINPYYFKAEDYKLSSDTISEMLVMATAMAMIPKPLLSLKNIPFLMIIIGIIVAIVIVSGGFLPTG